MLLWDPPQYGVKSEKHHSYGLAENAKCRKVEGVSCIYIKKRLICVPDMLSKKRDSALLQLFSILMCYRVDRNVTPQYSPSLLRPFFFVLPSCNIQAAFKKMGIAEHGMENSQATQQNYHLGIHQPHTKLTYISLYAQQYNRQLTNHTTEIRAETHLSHYTARDHILQKQASFLLQS
jgi:hypothetical protein